VARTIRNVLPCFLVLLALLLYAQSPNPPAAAQRADAPNVVAVTLGQATVPLYGPWKFTIGDSPADPRTGQPLWAEPGFDDSHWETVDPTPESGVTDPTTEETRSVPGWTARGHAGYSGYAWYRIRIRLEMRSGEKVAVAGPPVVDDGYQIFANERLVGSFGDFTGNTPVTGLEQPMIFLLPRPGSGNAGPFTELLAFRCWMHPGTLTFEREAGGLRSTPVLGEASVVTAGYRIHRFERARAYAADAVDGLVLAALALMAFSLILFDRSDQVYLWIGAVFLLRAIWYSWEIIYAWTQLSGLPFNMLNNALTSLIYAGCVMVWWVWFGRQRPTWLPLAVVLLAVLNMISATIGLEQFFTLIPHSVAAAFHLVDLFVRLLFVSLLVWIVIQGIRSQGLEGWLVLPAVLLLGVADFWMELSFMHVRLYWHLLGVLVTISNMADLLLAVAVTLLLLRRLLLSVRLQRQMALDMKQAQEVQQVILPERRIALPGFAIETEYRPVLEVGGDFYQIIPHPSDGSLLIVAGDVAGHGLKAGMLVALLIGAIRSRAEIDSDPAAILAALNRRLLGRSDARATCLALRIAADGSVKLANAGHLPPYLNGELLEVEGSLPLGLIEGAEPSQLKFQLAPSDRLLLVSDGVAEATNEHKELFGFDRVLELMRSHPSPAKIADTAQAFGQEDDISVISVTRDPAPKPAFA
jgi:Stage II sporulation protein E (SpoIIE)